MKGIRCVGSCVMVILYCSLAAMSLVHASESISPDGLQLSHFTASRTQGMVGDTVNISFILTNATDRPITFSHQFGVFIGARWNSISDANNRDFGHRFKGKVVRPGASIVVKSSRRLDAPGIWRFWPAYNVDGRWGPFRWNEIVVNVAALSAGSFVDEQGSADAGICPVHGISMKSVDLRMVYGMPSQREFEEMRVGKSMFPYGRDFVLAGCVVKPEKTRKGFLCSECVKARDAWLASKDRWDDVSRKSQASLEEFFAIVNSGDVDEAMKSMAAAMLWSAEDRRAWRRQLAAIRSIQVLDVEPADVDEWNDSRHIFKVTLEAYVDDVADAPIPFFGWHDNPNVRWITMELNSNRRWVVAGIATGP